MALLPVLEYPDPRLRQRARPVTDFDSTVGRLVDDMLETMYATRGIGLAATQVDVHLRVVTIDVGESTRAPQVFINPEVIAKSRMAMVEERCLSVPGLADSVQRATELRIRSLDRRGVESVRDVDGLLAVCLQHEIDHLDGKLFLDRLPFLARLRARARLAQARRHRSTGEGVAARV